MLFFSLAEWKKKDQKEWRKRKQRSRSVETVSFLFHLPEIYPSISLVSIALNVGHTHTQIRRKSRKRTGHILAISFCLDWLVPLQSTHWSNSLVDAWSLDPTLQWPLFILFFVPCCCCCCFLYHRVETDGRVIRNETTCNYRRDWRSYPYIFFFFSLLFIFQEKKREDRQWRPRRRRAPLPRSGSPTSCTRPAPLYGRNKSTIRVATRANRPAKHRYVTIAYTLIINNKKMMVIIKTTRTNTHWAVRKTKIGQVDK